MYAQEKNKFKNHNPQCIYHFFSFLKFQSIERLIDAPAAAWTSPSAGWWPRPWSARSSAVLSGWAERNGRCRGERKSEGSLEARPVGKIHAGIRLFFLLFSGFGKKVSSGDEFFILSSSRERLRLNAALLSLEWVCDREWEKECANTNSLYFLLLSLFLFFCRFFSWHSKILVFRFRAAKKRSQESERARPIYFPAFRESKRPLVTSKWWWWWRHAQTLLLNGRLYMEPCFPRTICLERQLIPFRKGW